MQKDVAYINWAPSDVTVDDVASFYAVDDSDHWTIIEDFPGVRGTHTSANGDVMSCCM